MHKLSSSARDSYLKVKAKYSFPYDLKLEQADIISTLLEQKNAFAVLPTGYGKSDILALVPHLQDEVSMYKPNPIVNIKLLKYNNYKNLRHSIYPLN